MSETKNSSFKKLISIAIALISGYWLFSAINSDGLWQPPLIFLITSLSALAFNENSVKKERVSKKISAHDVNLFNQLIKVLPIDTTIDMLKNHNFTSDFLKTNIEPLYTFVREWGGVDKEFMSTNLENCKKEIYEKAVILMHHFSEKVVAHGTGVMLTVRPDYHRGKPMPDFIKNQAEILNKMSRDFVTDYENFIRICRKSFN